MNSWRQHPALAGLPVPEGRLPPARSWNRAVGLGLVYPDGASAVAADRAAIAANPGWLERRRGTRWAGGPTPPLLKTKRGPVSVPGDAAAAVYLWLTEQAVQRLEAVKSHVKGRGPSVQRMAYDFQTQESKVRLWIKHALDKTGGRRFIDRLAVPVPTPFRPSELEVGENEIYFGSGAQGAPGDIEGLARLAEKHGGFGIGIEVSGCGANCRLALDHVAGRGVPVFVDSGAFPEFSCMLEAAKSGADPSDCEIGPAEWRRRLGLYEEIAKQFRSNANVVAPDMIGDQVKTERRLRDYGGLLKKTAATYKAWILLVAQGGRVPLHTFWERMRKLLVSKGVPSSRIVAAIPMKKKPPSLQQIAEFVRKTKVDRIHLLGIGPGRIGRVLDVIEKNRTGKLTVTYDSVLIKRGVGRGVEWLGVVPEVYTYAQDIVRYEIMSEAFQKSYRGSGSLENWIPFEGWGEDEVPDYTDSFEYVNNWLPKGYRKLLAQYLTDLYGLDPAGAKLLVSDAYDFLTSSRGGGSPNWIQIPDVEAWLDDQWARFLGSYYSAVVKRDGIVMAFRRGSLVAARIAIPGIDRAIEVVMFGHDLFPERGSPARPLFPGLEELI